MVSICHREIYLEEKKLFKILSQETFLKRPEIFRLSQFFFPMSVVQTKLLPIKYLVFNIANKLILGLIL